MPKKPKIDCHSAGSHQHGGGVVAGDGHQAVVFAVVRSGAAAQHAHHQVVGSIGNQVKPDEFLDLEGLALQFRSQCVDVEAHLVDVGGAFRDGGDEDQGNAESHAPGIRDR